MLDRLKKIEFTKAAQLLVGIQCRTECIFKCTTAGIHVDNVCKSISGLKVSEEKKELL